MRYFLCVLIFICVLNSNAQQNQFKTLEENVKSYYLMTDDNYLILNETIKELYRDPQAVDQVTIEVYQRKKNDSTFVNKCLKSFNTNGSWNDINYQDNKRSGWEPKGHAERILALTVLYSDPKSPYFQDQTIKFTIHKALDFWFKAKLVCPNWWYNEIGLPKTLGPVFIFLKSELSEEELKQAVIVLNNSSFKQTGQNKVWQAGNVLFKAILLEDQKLALRARDTIFSELKLTTDEGIQPDFSFHQHGPQQQFGNYGLSFVTSMSFWARTLSGTALKLDGERLSILRKLVLDGFNWVTWNGYLDVNALGRQFFKGTQASKSLALAYAVVDMMYVDKVYYNTYTAYISNNYSSNQEQDLLGTKHFWRSDMTIHHAQNWSSSVKLSSNRIVATEALNGENLKGYHMGDGTTFLYVDGDEYHDIFPVWNWKKLPGVTNYQKLGALPVLTFNGFRNKGDFTGGVTNGTNGITAFKLNRDSLTANKAWFYLNNSLISLGANITAKIPDSVTTTINQAFAKEKVMVFDEKLKVLDQGELASSSFKWIYHNKIGYFPLSQSKIKLTKQLQSGKWGDIANVYKGQQEITKDVFTLEIEHGKEVKGASYAYVTLPGISSKEMMNYKPSFEVLQNSNALQAIITNDKSMAMFVVYEPLKIKVNGFGNLNFKNAGLYTIEKNINGWVVHVSDPTQKLASITVNFKKKDYLVNLPQGENKGKTTNFTINQL
jgi:chondroitin AC lyase